MALFVNPFLSKTYFLAAKVRLSIIRASLWGVLLMEAPLALGKPRYVNAFFYQFTPTSCRVSLTGYGSSDCKYGAISVATGDRDSVNLHLMGKLGQWQLMLEEGGTLMPAVSAVLIRTNENVASNSPTPDFYYTFEDGGIMRGVCTAIPLTKKTSGRCVVNLQDGRTLDVSFATHSLKPVDDVQQSYH